MTKGLSAVTCFVLIAIATPVRAQQDLGAPRLPDPRPPVRRERQEEGKEPRGTVGKAREFFARLTEGEGPYPRLLTMTTGAGLSGGAGYRKFLLDRRGMFDVSGELSIKGYRILEASVEFPGLVDDRVYLKGEVIHRHFPEQEYFGLGGDSYRATHTDYRFDNSEAAGTLGYRPIAGVPFMIGVQLAHLTVAIGGGTDRKLPNIHDLFGEETAPGLTRQPNFMRTSVFAVLDTRDVRGNPTRGGEYSVSFGDFADYDLDAYSFKRFDAEAIHIFPVDDRSRFALRGRVTYANNKPGDVVPFYYLPTLGGSKTLRAFEDFRFRDENALLLNLEYRREILPFLDFAVFGDAGKVARNWEGLDVSGMIADYGVGLRFNTDQFVFARLDIAHGREGARVLWKFNSPF